MSCLCARVYRVCIVRFVQRDMYGRDACGVMQHTWGGMRMVERCTGVCSACRECLEIRGERRALCGREGRILFLPHVAVAEVAEGGGLAVDHAGLRHHAVHDALDEALVHVGTIQIPAGLR